MTNECTDIIALEQSPRSLLHFDPNLIGREIIVDYMEEPRKWDRDFIRRLFMQGRHYRFPAYYLPEIPPSARAPVDYVFVMPQGPIPNALPKCRE